MVATYRPVTVLGLSVTPAKVDVLIGYIVSSGVALVSGAVSLLRDQF
jgi:hypothetical protein